MKAAIAIARRDFTRYFTSPTGYVFITVFIALGAFAQFWDAGFFDRNLANLAMLNAQFPIILLFFIPAVAMTAWADERRHGTDELLLTMPVKDSELVVGKYLAALGIYGVSLLFSLSHVAVLRYLGHPDYGLMISTYVGYFLLGAALLPIAMIGSLLTESPTVAFIVGGMLCAIPVLWQKLAGLVGDAVASAGVEFGFRDFADGVVSLRGLAYFASVTATGLFVNFHLLNRRRHARAGAHAPVRAALLVVSAVALCVLSGRIGGRQDMTEERLHTLAKQTREIIQAIPADRPVSIQAFISPDVSEDYVETRETLVATLREIDAIGRGRIHLKIHETSKASEAAREADDKYQIHSVRVGRGTGKEIFLGVAFAAGADEYKIPFFYRGFSVEYELARAVRHVLKSKKSRVGILSTAMKWTAAGGRPWPIVDELKKQYEVTEVQPEDLKKLGEDKEKALDVLIVPMASTLGQAQLDLLREYASTPRAVVFLDDPLPVSNEPVGPNAQQRGAEPKGSVRDFYRGLGIAWEPSDVAWDRYNPMPPPQRFAPEIVFISPNNQREAFSPSSTITSGLQLAVLLWPGRVSGAPVEGVVATPLLRAGNSSGALPHSLVWQTNPYTGQGQPNMRTPREASTDTPTLALRVEGPKVNAIFVADVDFISNDFFEIRQDAPEHWNFDNITFFLNCVDALAGEQGFIELRKRRPKHRTLRTIEEEKRLHTEKSLEEVKKAEAKAEEEIRIARAEIEKAKQVILQSDMDEFAKAEQLHAMGAIENRKLNVRINRINDEKDLAVSRSEADRDRKIRSIQDGLRLLAIVLPPVPALAVFFIFLYRRVVRELESRR